MPAPASRPQIPIDRGLELLTKLIAVDSQSAESSSAKPSSAGQLELGRVLVRWLQELGVETEHDADGNVIATIPSNLADSRGRPKLVLMAHMDTSEGTRAVPHLELLRKWDGSRVPYPKNSAIEVSVMRFPDLEFYRGHDIIFGPGDAPIGLDDKLGLAELLLAAELLLKTPAIPHGEIVLVFRTDEEIGRHEVVRSLATTLAARGVTHGYTIDGIYPFEINTENFNACAATLSIPENGIDSIRPAAAIVSLEMKGAAAHGATAKSEGHLNSLTVFYRAMHALSGVPEVVPLRFDTRPACECDARAEVLLNAESSAVLESLELTLEGTLEQVIEPHRWKGVTVDISDPVPVNGPVATSARSLIRFLEKFFAAAQVKPLLPEESDGREGYTSPIFCESLPGRSQLEFRIRDFDKRLLLRRVDDVQRAASAVGTAAAVREQYVDMGPVLARYPELVEWASRSLAAIGEKPNLRPIRGGTGVDYFLEHKIPIANLGTGYFAPESPKELTSLQSFAKHVEWILELVQSATAPSSLP